MPRPQFTLRALLVAVLLVAAFFGGIRFKHYRYEREQGSRGIERVIREALNRKAEVRKRSAHRQ